MKHGPIAVESIVKKLESQPQDVANILAGPRREGWFNAEALVAISRNATLFFGVAYGEQGYRKVCKGLSGKTDKRSRWRIPDLVVYGRENDPVIIIEAKLVYRGDTQMKRDKAIRGLAAQILDAKKECPKAECIGVVYLVLRSSDPSKKM